MSEGFFATPTNRILGSLVLLMAIIAMGSYATLNMEKKQYVATVPATISVEGEGEVVAVPDIGRFSFSVTAKGGSASEAQELSGTKINEIVSYLEEQGVEEKDIKTENYNLYPLWRYEERVCPANAYCPPGERVQDGFEVTQSITVKVRNTDEAGNVITGVGGRGATNISGLDFVVDDTTALKNEARQSAITDAQQKAAELADQLGVRIVRMVDYHESGSNGGQYFETRAVAMDMASEEGFGGAVMPTGEETTTSRVTIVYEVR